MAEVVGFRCWDIDEDGTLYSPLNYGDDIQWTRETMAAVCEFGKSPVPDVICTCGFRAVPSLRIFRLAILRTPTLFLPKVVGLVTLTGRIVKADHRGDPPRTKRGEYATITGPLFLGQPFASAAQKVATKYGVFLVLASVPQLEWMQYGLADDWEDYQQGYWGHNEFGERVYGP